DKLGVRVATGQQATLETILASSPSVVVLATGEQRCQAASGGAVGRVDEMLQQEVPDKTSIVIMGADARSCELADHLTEERDNAVVVVTEGRKVAPMLTGIVRGTLIERLKE